MTDRPAWSLRYAIDNLDCNDDEKQRLKTAWQRKLNATMDAYGMEQEQAESFLLERFLDDRRAEDVSGVSADPVP